MNRTTISLLDPGLTSARGHHFDLDLRLARAFAARGHAVEIHAGARCAPEIVEAAAAGGVRLHRTFRQPPYAPLPTDREPAQAYEAWTLGTIEDLRGVSRAGPWVWPTLFAYQLAAAVRADAGVRQCAGAWWLPRSPAGVAARSWAASARALVGRSSDFLVGAYDAEIADAHRAFAAEPPIETLPCPHDGARRPAATARLARIGFFGRQREERGLSLIPSLVKALLARGYEVVVQDSGGSVGTSNTHPKLRVLPFVPDFGAEIAACDLVVWPSHAEPYVQRYSGVVAETIASGVPVAVPSGCLPAALAARFGCPLFFHEHSVASILEAIDEAAADYPAFAARALAAADAWHRVNGTARLADRICEWAAS